MARAKNSDLASATDADPDLGRDHDQPPAQTVQPLRLWSLERGAEPGLYLLRLRLADGPPLLLQVGAHDLLSMADAVLDDRDRLAAAARPRTQ